MTSVYSNNYSSFGNYNYSQHHKKHNDEQQVAAISAAGLGAASIGIQYASKFLADKLMQGDEFTTPENIHKVADEMLTSNGLKGKVDVGYIDPNNVDKFVRQHGEGWAGNFHTVAEGKNAFYADNLKLAVAPTSKPSLILHELGHAINANKDGLMKVLQKTRGISMYAPTALLFLAPLFQKKDENNKKNFIKDNAGLLGFAAFLPTIIEEGMASLRGIKAAGKKLGSAVDLKHLKRNYALAWGTYVLAGVGLGIAAKQSVIQQNN